MGEAWLILIAAWAIITGILEIITAFRLRKIIVGEFWLILGGVLSLVFGLAVAFYPQAGAFAIGLLIGLYAILFGVIFVALGLKLRSFALALQES